MKRKGSRTERELLHMFFSNKWSCIRTAGSGNTTELSTDLIAGKKGRVLAIECKSCKASIKKKSGKTSVRRYIQKKQIEDLKKFSRTFGAEPWIGMRYDREGWLFLKPHHLDKVGENYGVNLKLAKKKGIRFKDLIE